MDVKLKEKAKIIILTIIAVTIINLILFPRLLQSPDNPSSNTEVIISSTAESPATQTHQESFIFQESFSEIPSATTTSHSTSVVAENISAPYAGLYNLSTNEALYEKCAETKIAPASLTKVLTAVTVLTYMEPDAVIKVGSELELLPKRSSLCLIKKGHRLTVYDLLTGMLVASGNDAAYTLAVNVARHTMNRNDISNKDALSYFSYLMNSMAKRIGCTASNFTTPDGFDSEGQYTTIQDLMLICNYAMNFDEICEITSTVKKKVIFNSGENVTWSNSNKLLHRENPYYYSKAIGMKTGTTPLAGMSLVAVAEINSEIYMAIVSGCSDEDERYKSVIKLFNSVYST